MKVLVPTDFSTCAGYAFEAACQLAKKTPIELHLYHSANLSDDWESLPEVAQYHEMANQAISSVAIDKLKKLKEVAKVQGLSCTTHYSNSSFLSQLEELVEELVIDLVIIGSHGASGKNEWFVGSNAQKALRKLDTHVLVVKDQLPNLDFTKVLFATNLMVEDRTAFRHFLEFCKFFPLEEVHILTVDTNSFFRTPTIVTRSALADFAEMAKPYKCFTHEAKDFSVDQGIRSFAVEQGIQLIGMSNHQKHPLRHWLLGSKVEMIVNHADVPVLSIDYRDKKEPMSPPRRVFANN